ncbi:glycosyltransferase [Patescibacteria group bacterium]|nr:glycosyltransferase [Patescibacteria group bacterium]
MKILHAHKYYYMRAGAERYMLGLMRLQEKAGHTVAPFSMHYPKNLQSQWSEFFVPEMNTEEGGVNGFAALGQLKRAFWYGKASKRMSSMLDAFQPDILHVHNIYTHISPSILSIAKKQGIPVVMTVHDFALISANYALWDGTHPMTPEDLNIWRVA